jgi:Lrp/AsnC family transcriptional regulator, regulator for asnA, asnC and gidA
MAHTPGAAIIPGGESSDGSRRSRGDRPERLDRHDRFDRFERASRDRGRGGSRIALDEISKRIIEQLQQDGRRSYAAIGKAVGLSEAAVRQRVQRLTDNGVMQIVAVTDPMMLGFHRQTMIGIKCEGDLERVADHLAGMDEIDYVVITSGSFDLLVEVVCEDDDQLLEILSRVRMAPTVTSTETFVYLKLRKQTYSWGTR